jgi:hypothetical protein
VQQSCPILHHMCTATYPKMHHPEKQKNCVGALYFSFVWCFITFRALVPIIHHICYTVLVFRVLTRRVLVWLK